mmetsp:Transcript_9939/g.14648  ORF Transcript_9939/g.14648 Transcript_9939/m.14648 type:complete len:146 (+) Transcript_9939:46-483(+)
MYLFGYGTRWMRPTFGVKKKVTKTPTKQLKIKTLDIKSYFNRMLKVQKNNSQDKRDQLYNVFRAFDTDQSGDISAEEFQKGMKVLGHDVPLQYVKQLIKEVDINNDGSIDYVEFIDLFLGNTDSDDPDEKAEDNKYYIKYKTKLR